ncbi:hypothetical protein ACJX0J_032578, partial [Zea mays]
VAHVTICFHIFATSTDISGALWNEDTFVISLEEGHYAAYIKNYMAMQIIFGSGVATGRYMTDEDVVVEALMYALNHMICTCFGVSDSLMLSLLFGFGSCCLVFLSAISDSLVI